jgi:hypothetical protein
VDRDGCSNRQQLQQVGIYVGTSNNNGLYVHTDSCSDNW